MKKLKRINRRSLIATVLGLSIMFFLSCEEEPIDGSQPAVDAVTDASGSQSERLVSAKQVNPLGHIKPPKGFADSFSVNGKCYCKSTYDHGVGEIKVGNRTVREICEEMKAEMLKAEKGPGTKVYYNTVQCGHEPAHTDAAIKDLNGVNQPDEVLCPGEVGNGVTCNSRKGPKWEGFEDTPTTPAPAPVNSSEGPEGYTFAADERTTVNISGGTYDIAYGAKGKFVYKRNVTNNTSCTNDVFGDPIPGTFKKCYIKEVSPSNSTPPSNNNSEITFAAPANGTSLKAGYKNFYIKADVAPKAGRTIQEVRLYIDNKFIRTERVKEYEWGGTKRSKETEGLSVGTHTLKVEALDSAGEKSSTTTTITVSN